jgi:hypothetical protein
MKTTDGAVRHVPSAAGASAAAAEGNAQAEDEMATFTVTNTNDSGAGSLRQAILDANASPGADTIHFRLNDGNSGTVTLFSTLPVITDPSGLTIDGAGHITISGNHAVRVFVVDFGAMLTLKNLAVANGYAGWYSDHSESGAGIVNYGNLTVTNTTISNNAAAYHGAGIANFGGELKVTDSTFSDNHAAVYSGGIYNYGDLTITNSTFSNNTAYLGGGVGNYRQLTVVRGIFSGNTAFAGGAIYSDRSSAQMVADSVFSANSAEYGGGIYNLSSTLEVRNTTFSNNHAIVYAGGIANALYDSSLTVAGSTFSGNSASGGGGIANDGTLLVTNSTFSNNNGGSLGGGISSYYSLAVTNSTFSGNRASSGGGIATGNYGTATLKNTIITSSLSEGNCSGPIIDGGYNLDDGTSCNFSAQNHSHPGTDPLLDPDGLQDNGGPTQTIALLPGSPAINAIPNGTNGCGTTILTDQRGVARPQGSACDSGAVETVWKPHQAAEDLIDQVQDLVEDSALYPGQGNALIAKLQAAIKQLDGGNAHVTINQLQAFINQVEGMIASGILLAEQGQPLMDAANEIILVLSSYP